MSQVRPRLTDHHGILVPQAEVDFAIPFLGEDIPLYLDPFLLWRSPSQQDQSLHTGLVNCFNHLYWLMQKGRKAEAVANLIRASECDEVGFRSFSEAERQANRPEYGQRDTGAVLECVGIWKIWLHALRRDPALC